MGRAKCVYDVVVVARAKSTAGRVVSLPPSFAAARHRQYGLSYEQETRGKEDLCVLTEDGAKLPTAYSTAHVVPHKPHYMCQLGLTVPFSLKKK